MLLVQAAQSVSLPHRNSRTSFNGSETTGRCRAQPISSSFTTIE